MLKFVIDEFVTQHEINCLATDLGWIFADKIQPSDTNPLEIIWTTDDRQNFIHYVEDDWLGSRYFAFQGVSTDNLALSLYNNSRIKLYSLQDVLTFVERAEDPKEQSKIAAMLGILAPDKFDAISFNAFSQLLSSSSPGVRQMAILAAAYRGWPEFKRLLQHIKESDPEDFVRWRAEVALQAYDYVHPDSLQNKKI